MDKLENLKNMMNALLNMVLIDNDCDDPLFAAYNKGAYAMKNQVMYYINKILEGGEK